MFVYVWNAAPIHRRLACLSCENQLYKVDGPETEISTSDLAWIAMLVSSSRLLGLSEQLLRSNVKRFRGGLVFKAHSLLYHSTLGLRVIKKKKRGLLGVVDNQQFASISPARESGGLVWGLGLEVLRIGFRVDSSVLQKMRVYG